METQKGEKKGKRKSDFVKKLQVSPSTCYIWKLSHSFVWMKICMYVPIYMCARAHVYIYIYIHTHTHTHTRVCIPVYTYV